MRDAQQIIDNTLKKYAECNSYTDVGTTRTDNEPAVRGLRFKTAFTRDETFRFEFRQYHPHLGSSGPDNVGVVWSNGSKHSLCCSGKTRDSNGLINCVAGATGISAASIILVPTLLMPDLFAGRPVWLQLEGVRILSEEKLDDKNCFVLHGYRRITEFTTWIDTADFTIRKITQVMRSDLVTQYTYGDISFNENLAPELLAPNFPED